jgi:chemotaxis protein MotB
VGKREKEVEMEKRGNLVILGVFLLIVLAVGCAPTKKALREDLAQREERIQELEKEKEALAKGKEALEKMRAENERIKEEFQDYVVKSEIEVYEAKKGLVISFIDRVLFDSGRAEIKSQAHSVLEKVAQIIKGYPNRPVLIEGHTDNVPIGPRLKSRYQTNWELSTARAVAVLRYLIEKHNLPPEQLTAAGYGEYHPIADNESKEGRQKNRRVEIVIMPEKITRE